MFKTILSFINVTNFRMCMTKTSNDLSETLLRRPFRPLPAVHSFSRMWLKKATSRRENPGLLLQATSHTLPREEACWTHYDNLSHMNCDTLHREEWVLQNGNKQTEIWIIWRGWVGTLVYIWKKREEKRKGRTFKKEC